MELPLIVSDEDWPHLWDYSKKLLVKLIFNPSQSNGKWTSPLFEFTRALRAHPELRDLNGYEAAERFEEVVLTSLVADDDPWTEVFADFGSSDAKAEFIATWEKIHTPEGFGPVEMAVVAAAKLPLRPRREFSKNYRQFVSIAGHLQRSRPNKNISLPLQKMAQILGVDATTVSNYRKFAKAEGLLVEVAGHSFAQRLATEFSFRTELFDWETGHQIDCAGPSSLTR